MYKPKLNMRVNDCEHGFNITYGDAVIKSCSRNGVIGWALPGMRFTTNIVEAYHQAVMISGMLRAGGFKRVERAKRKLGVAA